jgi:hypothetical protein
MGRAVFMKDIVKPCRRRNQHIGAAARGPRADRSCCSPAPIDCSYAVLLGQRKNCVEGASRAARHVLGANQRAMELLDFVNPVLEALRPIVAISK